MVMESYINFKKKKIRSIFHHYENGGEFNDKLEEIESKLINMGMIYIQMKLPIKKITHEFEEKFRKKKTNPFTKANIRKASENDLESIVNVYNRAWITSNTPFSRMSVESLKKIYEYPETIIFIAKIYGIDAGFVILDYEGINHGYGVISGMGVLPRFQRKGIGIILGITSWDYFKKQGVKELRCEVYINNRASYEFIKSLGFEEFDRKSYKIDDFL